ncbi:nicotinamide mononucleotide adenylyltransferase [Ensifer adhaerens]|uniref:Nicotinamide mononucleotide adenylyltransferase n=1 Tax=Ensifer adhaerens TaxID=106592 RepID=A0ACC5SSL4_ENSAD|nr:hypothetical protein [Ensifer adhaerens]MBP1871842.1 nicotinamide mononucleotide adenylyltransferase [Ensifer adhaerens]
MCEAWQRSLIEEDELVKKAATTIPRLLQHPGITLDQASRLHVNIDECVERMDALILALEENSVDRSWIQMATTIRNSWETLAEDAAKKVLVFSGTSEAVVRDDTMRKVMGG